MKRFLGALALAAALMSSFCALEPAFAVVPNTTIAQSFTGDGTTRLFPFPMVFQTTSQIVVTLTTGGTTASLVGGVDYTVSGVGSNSGGTITTTVAPAAGAALLITRVVPNTQPVSFRAQHTYSPAIIESTVDLLEMQIQQVSSSIDGGVVVGPAGPAGPAGATGAAGPPGATSFWTPAAPPVTPDSRSEEFGETAAYACPASLTCSTGSGNPINVLANPVSGNPNYDLGNSRPGWLMMQSPVAGSAAGLVKPNSAVTFNTNDIMWARLSNSHNTEGSTNEHGGLFCLYVGDISFTHAVGVCLNSTGGTYSGGPTYNPRYIQAFTEASPSTFTPLGGGAFLQSETMALLPDYFLIMKTGSVYTVFMSAGENGSWTSLGTTPSQSWTPAAWFLSFKSTCVIGAGCTTGDYGGVDFVRFASGNQLP
jgi:hypothetical protein